MEGKGVGWGGGGVLWGRTKRHIERGVTQTTAFTQPSYFPLFLCQILHISRGGGAFMIAHGIANE